MTDSEKVQNIAKAITVFGPSPHLHRRAIKVIHDLWPTLFKAVIECVPEVDKQLILSIIYTKDE